MKTMRFRVAAVALLLLSIFGCKEQSQLEDGLYQIEIYATNDIHGRVFDSLYVVEEGEDPVHDHSMSNVSNAIKRIRESGSNPILVDIGDHLQGDQAAYYYNFIETSSPHIIAEVFNYLEYDAVVVGNHDIEPGAAVYNKVRRELQMPYLAANAIDIKSGKPYFEPYTIVERGGVKVAIIGMTNPNIPNWLAPHLWEGMEFEEITTSLNYWIKRVKEREGAHLVVVAMHAGLGEEESYNRESPARYVAREIEGIDLILAAHDHKVTVEKIKSGEREVLIVEGGSRAMKLSAAYLELEVKDGKIISINSSGESISMSDQGVDSLYCSKFREQFKAVKEFTNKEIGYLTESISTISSLFGSSPFVDMIHSLLLGVSGAEISFVAPLKFNSTIEAGPLIYKDLFDIYPFENQLFVISMSGKEIKDYLEYSYSLWINPNPKESGTLLHFSRDGGAGERYRLVNLYYNYDSAAGINYEVDITKEVGERVTILSMADGAPFDFEKSYQVALSSYRASGAGDLMELGAGIAKEELNSRVVERFGDIRDILGEFIVEKGKLDPKALNNWKFVPEEFAQTLIESDIKTLGWD